MIHRKKVVVVVVVVVVVNVVVDLQCVDLGHNVLLSLVICVVGLHQLASKWPLVQFVEDNLVPSCSQSIAACRVDNDVPTMIVSATTSIFSITSMMRLTCRCVRLGFVFVVESQPSFSVCGIKASPSNFIQLSTDNGRGWSLLSVCDFKTTCNSVGCDLLFVFVEWLRTGCRRSAAEASV